ncbi:MAG: AAA domain-containing protein [Clostridiales bacterium]|nr:AAA domain-containing protein [Clostridiales bacterium]
MINERIYITGKDGIRRDKTENIVSCERVGDKYHIFYKNQTKPDAYTPFASNVDVVKSALNDKQSNSCFSYLKEIAEVAGVIEKDEEKEKGSPKDVSENVEERDESKFNTLKAFKEVDFVEPDCALAWYLSGKFSVSKPAKEASPHIFPFAFNLSQKDALDKAFSNRLSIIEGPPGTGKTQVILNIVVNAVMQGKTVAVVSNNNTATENVLEKLEKQGFGFIAALLGKKENKEKFIASQPPMPDRTNWQIDAQQEASKSKDLEKRYASLKRMLEQKNDLAHLKHELSSIATEKKHFLREAKSEKTLVEADVFRKPKGNSSKKALDLWLLCEEWTGGGVVAELFRALMEIFSPSRRFIRKLLKEHAREDLIEAYQRLFYDFRIPELKRKIDKMEHDIENYGLDARLQEYTEISTELFRNCLYKKYGTKPRKVYNHEDFWKNSECFLDDYPIVMSTTYSLRSSLSRDTMYDMVIIDESSQVDICSGALALSCAKNVVVVGDSKQLPPVVKDDVAKITEEIFKQYSLSDTYCFKDHSLLSSLKAMSGNETNKSGTYKGVAETLLREHYRCHPKIIGFSNKKFYNDELIILTEHSTHPEPLAVHRTVKGNHARVRMNQRQIDVIEKEVIPEHKLSVDDETLGIIAPYCNQKKALLKEFGETSVKIGTVDGFQGQERKAIILSTVDDKISKFTDNDKRLNVAITRAIDQLIVVVSAEEPPKDSNIGDLIKYVDYHDGILADSKINSVFDMLYKCYAERRQVFLKKYLRVSEYASENLMYGIITEVLEEKKDYNLNVSDHVRLNTLLRNMSLLDREEAKYAMNDWTHVDFLIADTVTKTPRLAIEVDGSGFHKKGTRQEERDKMKDSILRKYNLPLLRFRTDGSGERERLSEELDRVMGGRRS